MTLSWIHTIWLWIMTINYIVLMVNVNRLESRISNGGL